MRDALIVNVLLAAAVLGWLGCNRKTSETDAHRLAAEALARYCETEKLSPSQFSLKKAGPAGDSEWLFIYVSSGIKPIHEVGIDIDKKGNVNVGRFIRDEE